MDIRIVPHLLSGEVTPPPSKSVAHRLLIAASLGTECITVHNVALSQDIEATLRCIQVLGGDWERVGDGICISPIPKIIRESGELPHFDCGESGSTLRFFIPIALAIAGGGIFTGHGRLMERPQKPYEALFREKGISFERFGDSLRVSGKLAPGEYTLPGDVSSQFFTGLMFALPLLDGDSTVVCSTKLESEDYILMTIDAIRLSGIGISRSADKMSFAVPHGKYRPTEQNVEADWSQAGFWYAAVHLGARLSVKGLNPYSVQGDRVLSELAEKLALPGDVEIDISPCPDLLPPLSVIASVRCGKTVFTNGARLRLKESDRLCTVCRLICDLGGCAEEGIDSLTVYGVKKLRGGKVDGANDHRIVMAAAIAACACTSEVIISGAEAVNKSYPDFFGEYTRLGGEVYVL